MGSQLPNFPTQPNLDILGVDTSWLPAACPCIFSLSPKFLHELNPTELSWTPVLPRHSCLDFYIPRWLWVPRAHAIPRNIFPPTFKSKKAIIVTTFAVKPPPPTCKTLTLCNLPHGKFWIILTLSAPMQCPIVSFSASPEEIAAQPVSKNTQLYSTRQLLHHDPVELASHRDDRIFRSKQIWVQGLPDPAFPFIASISNSHALVTQPQIPMQL